MGKAALMLFAATAVAAVSSCGSSSHRKGGPGNPPVPGRQTTATAGTASGSAAPRLVVTLDPHRLPAPVSGEATVAYGAGALSIGGLDSEDVSTDRIVALSSSDGSAHTARRLTQPLHDAAAAVLGGRALVFGGGATTELDTVQALNGTPPSISSMEIGHLPGTRSDLSAISLGQNAYLLGGYDGTAPNAAVLRTSDGAAFTTAGQLPVAFRYAAVAALGAKIYAFGGETASGGDSDAIQLLDTASGQAKLLGRLPRALSHASAVALGGRIYVLGGRSAGSALRDVLAFDPATGRVSRAGELPLAITNAAAVTAGGRGWLVGGIGAEGATLDTIVELRLSPA